MYAIAYYNARGLVMTTVNGLTYAELQHRIEMAERNRITVKWCRDR